MEPLVAEELLADVEGADEILARARAIRDARPPDWHQAMRIAERNETPSQRELEVLDVISHGLSNAAAADVLYLSPHTIAAHMKAAMRKLGARDRTHAVALAIRRGLIPTTEGET